MVSNCKNQLSTLLTFAFHDTGMGLPQQTRYVIYICLPEIGGQ